MEDIPLSLAHNDGIAAYERRVKAHARVDYMPLNPYGTDHGASPGWAWELGWRMADAIH